MTYRAVADRRIGGPGPDHAGRSGPPALRRGSAGAPARSSIPRHERPHSRPWDPLPSGSGRRYARRQAGRAPWALDPLAALADRFELRFRHLGVTGGVRSRVRLLGEGATGTAEECAASVADELDEPRAVLRHALGHGLARALGDEEWQPPAWAPLGAGRCARCLRFRGRSGRDRPGASLADVRVAAIPPPPSGPPPSGPPQSPRRPRARRDRPPHGQPDRILCFGHAARAEATPQAPVCRSFAPPHGRSDRQPGRPGAVSGVRGPSLGFRPASIARRVPGFGRVGRWAADRLRSAARRAADRPTQAADRPACEPCRPRKQGTDARKTRPRPTPAGH